MGVRSLTAPAVVLVPVAVTGALLVPRAARALSRAGGFVPAAWASILLSLVWGALVGALLAAWLRRLGALRETSARSHVLVAALAAAVLLVGLILAGTVLGLVPLGRVGALGAGILLAGCLSHPAPAHVSGERWDASKGTLTDGARYR